MRANQGITENKYRESLYVELQVLNEKLSELMSTSEQPCAVGSLYGGHEMHATRRWWMLAQLKHILTDMENYIGCKLKMQLNYTRLKDKMMGSNGKCNFLNEIQGL